MAHLLRLHLLVVIALCNSSAGYSSIPLGQRDQAAVDTFAHFLRFKTVSSEAAIGHVLHPGEFTAAHKYLEQSFPTVYQDLEVKEVANYSLLFKWEGTDAEALPLALLSHQDVVPAEEGPDSPWTQPPFGGIIKDGWVYGRGAIDTKFSLVAILQAAEELLLDNFKPSRTIYFSFGHDEEVGGDCGAAKLAQLLADRDVELDFVLDEGGMILTDGMPPLTTQPVAAISTAEKGFESVDVQLNAPGGHSSRPPIDKSSVLEVMGRILTRVSDSPPPLQLVAPVPDMLKALAPGASSAFFAYLFRHSENRLVKPVVAKLLSKLSPTTAALVRTTVAPTLANAGLQDNVLPERGTITYNFRTLPGERQLFPEEYLWEQIGEDKSRADVRPRNKWTTGEAAPASGPAWELITQAISNTYTQYEDLLIAPNLLSGATDSRHYSTICKQGLYRFSGLSLSSEETVRVHGIDERIKAKDYLKGVQFFKELIKLSSGSGSSRA